MSRPRTIGSLVATVVIAGAACDTRTTAPAVELEWQGTVEGLAGWEQLSGEAAFRWTEGQQHFTAGMALSGDEPGAVRPWHVHFNTCAQGGGIVGGDASYPRLAIQADGTAAVTTEVPFVPSPAVAYHVNVHLSEAQMDVIIACGDLPLAGMGSGAPTAPPNIPGY
jgi:superoxide dismutase, Cu-Zn family